MCGNLLDIFKRVIIRNRVRELVTKRANLRLDKIKRNADDKTNVTENYGILFPLSTFRPTKELER